MTFVWSDSALVDLQGAIKDAEAYDPTWADALLEEIQRVEALLSRHPRAGPLIDGSDRRKLRLGVLPFVLIYRLREPYIDAVRLHHAKADWRP